jgi:hypothetical protein
MGREVAAVLGAARRVARKFVKFEFLEDALVEFGACAMTVRINDQRGQNVVRLWTGTQVMGSLSADSF